MKAGIKPAIRTDVNAGDFVWFYDRRNGRITENIASVHCVKADGTLTIAIKDQGSTRVIPSAPEWVSGATHGWVMKGKSCS